MKFVSKSPTPYTISLKRNKIVLLFKVNYLRESSNRYLYKSIKSVSLENIYTSCNIKLRHRINTATYFNTLYCLSYRRPIRELFFFNNFLHPNFSMQALHINLYTFSGATNKENLSNNQEFL